MKLIQPPRRMELGKMINANVFKDPNVLKNFLTPGKHSNLPMVELPASLNPFGTLLPNKVIAQITVVERQNFA